MPKEALNNPEVEIEAKVDFLTYQFSTNSLVAVHTEPYSGQQPDELVKQGWKLGWTGLVAISTYRIITGSGKLNGQDIKFGPNKQVISTIYPDGKVYELEANNGILPSGLDPIEVSRIRRQGVKTVVLMRNGILQPFNPSDKVTPIIPTTTHTA